MQIKVAKKTKVKGLSTSIRKSLEENGNVDVRAMGAETVNIAVKALAIANFFTHNKVEVVPKFDNIETDGKKTTVIVFSCRLKPDE